MSEETMFLDCSGIPIRVGDVVQATISINQHVHGDWVQYRVRKAPGGYVLAYHCSEKGAVLPPGYTGGFMTEVIPEDDEQDMKSLIFAVVPIQISGWRVIPAGEEGLDWDAERAARATIEIDQIAKGYEG